jgi:serine/arginine repetitive matrix protein 1
MEMLEIANYGHRLRQNIASASGPYGSKRRRAGSIGGGRERDSVVFDDTYEAIDMVLDEMPLTDMEGDTETEREMSFTREAQSQAAQTAQLLQQQPQQAHVRTVSAAGSASRIPTSQQRSVSASTSHEQQARSRKNSQIPRPQQTSSQTQGGASARSNGVPTEAQFNTPARAYAAANMPFSAANESLQPLATSTPKRGRAKSPATPSKKAKTRPNIRSKSAVDVRTTKEEDIAEYPDMPDDSQLADAIPTWTKPVPKGNWDEVSTIYSIFDQHHPSF